MRDERLPCRRRVSLGLGFCFKWWRRAKVNNKFGLLLALEAQLCHFVAVRFLGGFKSGIQPIGVCRWIR